MKEDKYVKETVRVFLGDLRGVSTNEFYEIYCEVCNQSGVEPRAKSIVVKLARELCDVKVVERRKVIVTKYFESKDYDGYN